MGQCTPHELHIYVPLLRLIYQVLSSQKLQPAVRSTILLCIYTSCHVCVDDDISKLKRRTLKQFNISDECFTRFDYCAECGWNLRRQCIIKNTQTLTLTCTSMYTGRDGPHTTPWAGPRCGDSLYWYLAYYQCWRWSVLLVEIDIEHCSTPPLGVPVLIGYRHLVSGFIVYIVQCLRKDFWNRKVLGIGVWTMLWGLLLRGNRTKHS